MEIQTVSQRETPRSTLHKIRETRFFSIDISGQFPLESRRPKDREGRRENFFYNLFDPFYCVPLSPTRDVLYLRYKLSTSGVGSAAKIIIKSWSCPRELFQSPLESRKTEKRGKISGKKNLLSRWSICGFYIPPSTLVDPDMIYGGNFSESPMKVRKRSRSTYISAVSHCVPRSYKCSQSHVGESVSPFSFVLTWKSRKMTYWLRFFFLSFLIFLNPFFILRFQRELCCRCMNFHFKQWHLALFSNRAKTF